MMFKANTYVIGGINLEIKLITKPPITCNPQVAAIGGK
jgi:hypothetical protein